jgi:hypothetical protein
VARSGIFAHSARVSGPTGPYFLGRTFGEFLDAKGAGLGEARGMSTRSLTIHVTLTIDGETISGYATAGSRPPHRFHGWLGLMSAVDAIVGAPTHPLASPADGGGAGTGTQH